MKFRARSGKKVRFLSVCLEIGCEKNLLTQQEELTDVEIYVFSPKTNAISLHFLEDGFSPLPFLIIADEETKIVFEGSPKSINLTGQIEEIVSKPKKTIVSPEMARKLKLFFSDPKFLALINSQLQNKKLFDFKFGLEIYRNYDQNLGKVFEEFEKPKLAVTYHVAHAEFVSLLLKKIFAQFPKELFYLHEKCIESKETKHLCISVVRNQLKALLPTMPEENFSMVIVQQFQAIRNRNLDKSKKALLFLGQWPKSEAFKIFKANITNFKYFFGGHRTILGKFDFLFFNETEKQFVKKLLTEQKFISRAGFNNLCDLLKSKEWVEEWEKGLEGLNYDFNVIIEFYRIVILNPSLERKDVVFTKPRLELHGDKEEITKIEALVEKIIYPVTDPMDFCEIKKEFERIVSNLIG